MIKDKLSIRIGLGPRPSLGTVSIAVLMAVFMLSAQPAWSQDPVRMIPASFADVARKASPAVVNIATVKTAKLSGPPGHRFVSR